MRKPKWSEEEVARSSHNAFRQLVFTNHTTRTAGLILLEKGHASLYSNDGRCVSVAANGGMAEDLDGSPWIKALSGL